MLNALTWMFGRSSENVGEKGIGTTKSIGKVNELFKHLTEREKRNGSFWNDLSLKRILWMQWVVERSGVEPDHPFAQKLQGILQTYEDEVKRHFERRDSIIAEMWREQTLPNGNSLQIPFAKGGEEVVFKDVNDDLLKKAFTQYPQLSSLTVRRRLDESDQEITDKGIIAIGGIPSLTKLELFLRSSFYITPERMNDLLRHTSVGNRITELALHSWTVTDESLGFVEQFANLTKLNIRSESVTAFGVLGLIRNLGSREKLKKLELYTGCCDRQVYTEEFVQSFVDYTQLSELSLEGGWRVDRPILVNLATQLTCLNRLELHDYPILPADVAAFQTLTGLKDLRLENCFELKEKSFADFIRFNTSLNSLYLGKASSILDQHVSALLDRNLRSLALRDCKKLAKILSDKRLSTLTQLHLSGNDRFESDSFAPLAELTNLCRLRLESCERFNDISMKALTDGPLASYLETLELHRVSISDEGMNYLDKFVALRELKVGHTFSVTSRGVATLLKKIGPQLTKLYLDKQMVTKEIFDYFRYLENLDRFVLSNPRGLQLNEAQHLLTLLSKNTEFLITWN